MREPEVYSRGVGSPRQSWRTMGTWSVEHVEGEKLLRRERPRFSYKTGRYNRYAKFERTALHFAPMSRRTAPATVAEAGWRAHVPRRLPRLHARLRHTL